MENVNTNHQLIAIRMRWLNWLSTPIVAVWNFIVESMKYLWSIIQLAWRGMKESINHRYWIIASVGGSVSIFLVLAFIFIGTQTGEPGLASIGIILAVLPIAWAYAEIANLIQYKKQNGKDIDLKDMKNSLGIGLNAIKFLALYVATIIIMIIAQVALDFLGLIPTVGPLFLGIIVIPVVVASFLIISSTLILSFGTPILGAHLLTEKTVEGSLFFRFLYKTRSLVKVLSKVWLEVILISYPAIIFGALVSLLPALLIGLSVGLSFGIATGIAGDNLNSLLALVSPYGKPALFEYLGGLFLAISVSVLGGIILSFYLSSFACTYELIYNNKNNISFSKKLFGLLIAFIVFGPFLAGLGF
tara:strand:- start:294 stop:1370 length:1077 start_codon:yes stop_codon:yes gene_type:complete